MILISGVRARCITIRSKRTMRSSGRVSDLVVEPDAWAIRYLVVDKGGPVHAHRFLVSVNAVHKISWDPKLVKVALGDEPNGGPDVSRDANC